MNDISSVKAADRKRASKIRNRIGRPDAGNSAAAQFLKSIKVSGNDSVSLYLPIGSELDTAPLLEELEKRQIPTLLPLVIANAQPLRFKKWICGDPLISSTFGTRVPDAAAEIGIPNILVVPLLAFDSCGFRLGYGGGFYDRTLEMLRDQHKCVAVGFAYSGQEVDKVTIDDFDQSLDWIVTEKYARKIL